VENESFLWTSGSLQLWPIARCRAGPYDANTPMATSAGELREARGAEARATSGASRAAQSKKRQYEVRRRNGHRKVARTLADRILVLTKAVQGNLDGFVALTRAIVVQSSSLPHAAPVECAICCETSWIAQVSCGCARRGYCATKMYAVMMRARRPRVDREQREARRQGSHHGRRQPHGDDTAETTFVALLAARSARTSADRFSCTTKPPGSRQAASSRQPRATIRANFRSRR
jgi:hypothetical protein